jgi:diguanylate cyclase (GGDEF)-like protein/PAS domain S-box-containing protein
MKVLLAENQGASRDLFQRLLEQRGHAVHAVADGEIAWRVCQNEAFPLVLIGRAVSGTDGLDLCRRIRTLPQGAHCVLLILTEETNHKDLIAAIDSGADDCLSLPMAEDLALVRMIVAERRALKVLRGQFGAAPTRARAALRTLRESEELFRAAFRNAAVGMALLAADGLAVRVNSRLCDMLGYPEAELLRRSFPHLIHPDDRPRLLRYLQRAGRERDHHGVECRYLRAGGAAIWCQIASSSIENESGQVAHHVLQLIDITARKQAEDYLTQLAHYDLLTGIPNRALFHQRLAQAISQARRHQGQLALLFVDLDGFKAVNDTMGHAVGDLLLQVVAERITQCVRADDMVARLAGDEFTVLLPRIRGTEAAERVARTIVRDLARPIVAQERILHVTSSVGVAIFPDAGHDVETLLAAADAAMYLAKSRGKNGFAFCQVETRAAV